MNRLLLVCAGSAIGGGARFLLGTWIIARFGTNYPYATLAVNVIGSFLIGLIMQLSDAGIAITPTVRLFLTTGIMAGFTTYSSFNYETLHLLQSGESLKALMNIFIMLSACFAAGLLGFFLAKQF